MNEENLHEILYQYTGKDGTVYTIHAIHPAGRSAKEPPSPSENLLPDIINVLYERIIQDILQADTETNPEKQI